MGMVLILKQPDTEYGLGSVRIRFTVDASIPMQRIPIAAVPHLKKAIEQFERIGDGKGHHWKFRDDIPIRFEFSPMQADTDALHQARHAFDAEHRVNTQGLVDCVAIVTFVRPLDWIDPDVVAEKPGLKEGFADYEDPAVKAAIAAAAQQEKSSQQSAGGVR